MDKVIPFETACGSIYFQVLFLGFIFSLYLFIYLFLDTKM